MRKSNWTVNPLSHLYSQELKEKLHQLFCAYGKILKVCAKANIRMRGQAFVIFDDKDVAEQALNLLQGFILFGKPMVDNS